MSQFISTETNGAVAVITIDNPPLNPLSEALLADLEAELDRLDTDDAIRAIVVRGGGERAFVAGADIKEFQTTNGSGRIGPADGLQSLGRRMDAARTPLIAAIQGFCLGGGLELAMCCDMRICSDDAKLGQPEIKLGLIPGGGGTQRLPRLVGPGRAAYLNMTGDFIDAATAERFGLVERVVPREELLATAVGLATTIASRSPHSLAVLRELQRTTRTLPLEQGLRHELEAFMKCIQHEDGIEGVAAFLEKREPQFGTRAS